MGDFVSFDLAKKLKEKGYPNNTSHQYNEQGQICVSIVGEDYPYPCLEIHQVLKWLRDEKKIHIEIRLFFRKYGFDILHIESRKKLAWSGTVEYNSYESAAIAGIEYILDNLI